eukprot:SAG11_NODE_128_length_15542_cov_6.432105_11_plen_113_part_00
MEGPLGVNLAADMVVSAVSPAVLRDHPAVVGHLPPWPTAFSPKLTILLRQVPGLRLVAVQGAEVADLPSEEVLELIKFSKRCAPTPLSRGAINGTMMCHVFACNDFASCAAR